VKESLPPGKVTYPLKVLPTRAAVSSWVTNCVRCPGQRSFPLHLSSRTP
jgi:hypothetical protein